MDELKWLIAREIPHLRRYARGLVGDPSAADDLVQDTLERALRKRHQWQRRGSIRGWLFRILYTVFVNGLKTKKYRSPALALDEIRVEPSVPAPQAGASEARSVLRGLMRLAPEQRAVILLVALEGMRYDEVATVMGTTVGTVSSRLSRGREALREMGCAPSTRAVLRRVK